MSYVRACCYIRWWWPNSTFNYMPQPPVNQGSRGWHHAYHVSPFRANGLGSGSEESSQDNPEGSKNLGTMFLSHNLVMIFIIILLGIIWLMGLLKQTWEILMGHAYICLPWVNGLWIKTWCNSFRPPSLMIINRPQASLLTEARSMSSSCTGVFTAEVSAYLVEKVVNSSCCGLHVHLKSERCHESRPLLFINEVVSSLVSWFVCYFIS